VSPVPLTHEQRLDIIRAPITRGILATSQHTGMAAGGGALPQPVAGKLGSIVGRQHGYHKGQS
jgi:hypothetical protein